MVWYVANPAARLLHERITRGQIEAIRIRFDPDGCRRRESPDGQRARFEHLKPQHGYVGLQQALPWHHPWPAQLIKEAQYLGAGALTLCQPVHHAGLDPDTVCCPIQLVHVMGFGQSCPASILRFGHACRSVNKTLIAGMTSL